MGCIWSRLVLLRNRTLEGRRSSHSGPNIFTVLNVDDMSHHVSPGKLEVTETDLVLHLQGKPPLTWPIRCLRRYGSEEDLFSFESGRRCSTGAGIYTFKCNRAQSLFNLLQAKIQGSNPSNTPVPSAPITPNVSSMSPTFDYVNTTENSLARPSTEESVATRLGHGPGGVAKLCQAVPKTDFGERNHPVYMNIDGNSGNTMASAKPSHSATDGPNQTIMNFTGVHKPITDCTDNVNRADFSSQSSSAGVVNSSVVYTNVDCSGPTPKRAPEINYAELELQTDHLKNVSNTYSNFSSSKSKHLTFVTRMDSAIGQDLEPRLKSGESSEGRDAVGASGFSDGRRNSSPKHGNSTSTSTHNEVGYAMIDFDRTAALSLATRSRIKIDFSSTLELSIPNSASKKNRHNSTAL